MRSGSEGRERSGGEGFAGARIPRGALADGALGVRCAVHKGYEWNPEPTCIRSKQFPAQR